MPLATDPRLRAWTKLIAFIALTAAFTYGLPWQHLPIPGGLMWGPGFAAMVVQLAFERRLSGLGWRAGAWRWWGLALLLPLGYAAAAYLVGWFSGTAPLRPDAMAWMAEVLQQGIGLPVLPDWAVLPAFIAAVMSFGLLMNTAAALGEEIGWRGLMVPALAPLIGWRGTALASGVLWALWHWPGIFFGGYHASTPLWYGTAMFSLMIIAMSVPMAWLTWRSRSLWPATLFHAGHNIFIQGAFGPLTVQEGASAWLVGEFGVLTMAASVAVAAWFWMRLPRGPASAPLSAAGAPPVADPA